MDGVEVIGSYIIVRRNNAVNLVPGLVEALSIAWLIPTTPVNITAGFAALLAVLF